jgi:hypothetical protein
VESILPPQQSGTGKEHGILIVNLQLPLIPASVMSIRSPQKSGTAASFLSPIGLSV